MRNNNELGVILKFFQEFNKTGNIGISLPLLLPVLAAAVNGTRELWGGHPIASSLRLLAAYAVALLAASLLLYDHLWED